MSPRIGAMIALSQYGAKLKKSELDAHSALSPLNAPAADVFCRSGASNGEAIRVLHPMHRSIVTSFRSIADHAIDQNITHRRSQKLPVRQSRSPFPLIYDCFLVSNTQRRVNCAASDLWKRFTSTTNESKIGLL